MGSRIVRGKKITWLGSFDRIVRDILARVREGKRLRTLDEYLLEDKELRNDFIRGIAASRERKRKKEQEKKKRLKLKSKHR